VKLHHAEQIAALINARNALTKQYTTDIVLQTADNFLYRLADDEVSACVEVKRVQWYQAEINHLSVSEAHLRKGLGRSLVREAIAKAKGLNCRVAQCTIRIGNEESEGLFLSESFRRTSAFHNARSGNDVTVFQLVLVPAGA
jgi:GNAT superfamily N-acetyltransferase